MFSEIKISEDNFEKVLEKLQKITKKHHIWNAYYSATDTVTHEIKYHSYGWISEFDAIILCIKELIKYHKDFRYKWNSYFKHHFNPIRVNTKSFYEVIKHPFREAYENKDNEEYFNKSDFRCKYDIVLYNEMHSLIWIGLGSESAMVLSIVDIIKFIPNGFIIKMYNKIFDKDNLTEYKYINFYNPFNKINYNEELTKRNKETEEIDKMYEKEYFDDNDYNF